MQEILPWIAAAAGLGVIVAWAVRVRAGRDPLGLRPPGPLPDTSLAVAVAILVWIAGPMVIAAIPAAARLPGHPGATAAAILHAGIAIVLLPFVRRGAPRPLLSPVSLGIAGVLAGLATFGVVGVVGEVVKAGYAAAGHAVPVQDVVAAARESSGLDRVTVFAVAAVLAPFAEEVFWRGAVLPALAVRTGVARAIVAQGVLFGAIHVVGAPMEWWPLAIPLAVVGAFAGWIYVRTASIVAAMLLHATFNGLHLVFL